MPEISQSRYMVQAGWDDVPHLDEKTKRELLASYPEHERDARTKGVPSLGSGAIYPIEEEAITCAPFQIPAYWPRAYGLDVGWKKTAALWGAMDRETDTLYCYTEYYRGHAEPAVHVQAIMTRGAWIPGVIDPASRGRAQADGTQLMQIYTDLGLTLSGADNAVEAGLYDVFVRMTTGRLKIFRTCQNTLNEWRIYRRNDKGAVVKENDHLMDALRYLTRSGLRVAAQQPVPSGILPQGCIGDRRAGY